MTVKMTVNGSVELIFKRTKFPLYIIYMETQEVLLINELNTAVP